MQHDLIFHLLKKENWKSLIKDGEYKPESIEAEGFIHCSTGDQVASTANLVFSESPDLWLLIIDTKRVVNPIKYEVDDQREEKFPHIYGPLNLDALLDKILLTPNEQDVFEIDFSSHG